MLRTLKQAWSSKRLTRLLIFLASWAMATVPVGAQAAPSEDEVKAVFLFNFANFIRWADSPVHRASATFRFCVLDDDLASLLGRVVTGESADGKPMSVVTKVDAKGLSECRMLYLGEASLARPGNEELIQRAFSARVLTVSDQEEFLAKGGMIALSRKRGRIHPIINLDATNRADFSISSKLLRLSTVQQDNGSDRK